MWKPGSKWIAALLIGGAIACSDSATAPTMAPPDGAAMYVEGGQATYEGTCGLWVEEVEDPYFPTYYEQVVGRGECQVSPFGAANLRFEGYEVEGTTQSLLMGGFEYTFADGSKLFSTVWMVYWGSEYTPPGGYFSQQFSGGTGIFAGVTGGAGYGPAMWNEELYRANYTSSGNILFGAR